MTKAQRRILLNLSKNISAEKFRELHDCIFLEKLIRLEVTLNFLPRIKLLADSLGLKYSISDCSFNLIVDPGMENWSSSIAFCDDSHKSAMRFVYLHKDQTICEAAKKSDHNDDDYQLGLLLRYPKCCIESYIEWHKTTASIDPIDGITKVYKYSGKVNNFRFPNPFTRYIGYGLISHFPCSLQCEQTINAYKESFKQINVNFPSLSSHFSQFNKSLVVYKSGMGLCVWKDHDVINNIISVKPKSLLGQGELFNLLNKANEITLLPNKLDYSLNSVPFGDILESELFVSSFDNTSFLNN